jgi:hypothetical protein
MLRRIFIAFTFIAATSFAGIAHAQMPPGPGGFGGPGGPNLDPATMQQLQQMQGVAQQVMQNMQNAGVDPQQFMMEQMQNGNFDPSNPASMMQTAVDQGFMTPEQANQMAGTMNNLMQTFQNQRGLQGNPATRGNALLNNIRRELGIVADDEWAALAPRIQRVLSCLADVRQNNPTGVSTGTLPDPTPNPAAAPDAPNIPAAQESPLARAWRELQLALQDNQTPESQIHAKLAAWRQLHDAAKADLAAAQTSLQQLLTLRQEAVLISLGIL